MNNSKIKLLTSESVIPGFSGSPIAFQTESSHSFKETIKTSVINLVVNHLSKGLDRKSLIKKYFNSSENSFESYPQGKAIAAKLNFLFFPQKEICELRRIIAHCLSEYINIHKFDYNGISPKHIHSWTNIYKKKPSEAPHLHSYHPLNISGVFYLCGDFQNHNGAFLIYPNRNSSNCFSYEPKSGDILLFPSTLLHAIGKYEGHTPRISIAFDIWFKPKKTRKFITLE